MKWIMFKEEFINDFLGFQPVFRCSHCGYETIYESNPCCPRCKEKKE